MRTFVAEIKHFEEGKVAFFGAEEHDQVAFDLEEIDQREYLSNVKFFIIKSKSKLPKKLLEQISENQTKHRVRVILTDTPNKAPVEISLLKDDSILEDMYLDSVEEYTIPLSDEDAKDPELFKFKTEFLNKSEVYETQGLIEKDLGRSFRHGESVLTVAGWDSSKEETCPVVVLDKQTKDKYFMSVKMTMDRLERLEVLDKSKPVVKEVALKEETVEVVNEAEEESHFITLIDYGMFAVQDRNITPVKRTYEVNNLPSYKERNPAGLVIAGDLVLDNTNTNILPDNLSVIGSLYARKTKLTKVQKSIIVSKDIDLSYSPVEELHDDMTISGNCILSGTKMKVLPKNLSVGKILDISETEITKLPSCLKVGLIIYSDEGQLKSVPRNLKAFVRKKK